MNEKTFYNLTHAQKRIWYVEKMNPGRANHNIGGFLRIEGEINVRRLEKAIQLIIKHNDGLRLVFQEINDEVVQYVNDYHEENIDVVDFSEKENKIEQFNQWTKGVFALPFDLIENWLYYFAIYKLSDLEYGVLLNIHHLIADGWSIHLIEKQLCNYYKDLEQEEDVSNLNYASYIDYIKTEKAYLESSRFLKDKKYWNAKFEILPQTTLSRKNGDLRGKRKSFKLGLNESEVIRRFVSQQKQLSLATFFTAIKLIYLHKTKSTNDIILGVPVFNRSGQKEKNIVGMFTSSVPLRFTFKPGMSGIDVLSAVNKELKSCLVHQKYPYNLLVNDLHLRKAGYESLFDISINYYNTRYSNQLRDIPVKVEECYAGDQSYSLQIVVKEWLDSEEIELLMDYKICDYSDIEVERMYTQMMKIATFLIENGEEHVENLSLDYEQNIKNVFETLNQTKTYYPREKTVIDIIEERTHAQPNDIALVFKESSLTYGEMNQKINQLAHFFERKGVVKGDRVAIITTHSYELIIGILATLKVGAAYVPIDPKYPLERIEYMLQDSNAKILYTNIKIEGLLYNLEIVSAEDQSIENVETTAYVSKAVPEDIAYIIYTSGSSGTPKGVMIEHKGLMNYIWWAGKTYLKDEKEIFALYSSISFDLTITSIFTPLLFGQVIVIYEDKGEEFILYRVLEDNKATIIKVTPSHLTLIKDRSNQSSSIKRFIVGGENLPIELAKETSDSFGGKVEIYNEYGPTETVVGCMIYQFRPEYDLGYSVPIGKPADNVEIYLFNEKLQLVTPEQEGEIYIAGDGIARGYLNKEDLTNNVFIQLNNEQFQNKRMYKSGDLGKMLTDGNIIYIGRADNQVKLRGFRIELGEIESAIRNIDFVKEAIVHVKKDINGNDALCTYIVSDHDFSGINIKKQLFNKIPAYMVPSYYMKIEKIPLTSNGKVDYKQLPDIPEHLVENIMFRNDTERQFVQIVEEVLGKESVSMISNYFQIGGDSIKAIQIVSKLKKIGLTLKVQDIMEKETLEDIVLCIDQQPISSSISQLPEEGAIRQTPITQWFLEQKMEEPNYFNQSVLLELKEKIKIENIQIALKKIVEHHDTLRLNFNTNTQELYYNNHLLEQEIEIEYVNLTALDNETFDFTKEKIKEISEKVKGSITLDQGLMIKACLITVNPKSEFLLLTAHHLVIDGVSWRIILEDLLSLLTQIKTHQQDLQLPAKTHSFKEWATGLYEYSQQGFSEEVEYWKEILDHPSNLPKDFDRPIGLVKDSVTLSYELDEKISNELIIKVKQYYNMDFNELLISSLALTIHKTSGREEVVFEVERHGREQINEELDISRTIGWFTSIYPVHVSIKENNLLAQLKELKELLRKVPNKGFNFSILRYLNGSFENIHTEPIRFNYLGDFDHILESDVCQLSSFHTGSEIGGKNKLTALVDVIAFKLKGKLQISVTFSSDTFKQDTMQSFLDRYINILKDIHQLCSTSREIEFTPSDFNEADISEEDLDLLFSN